MSTTSIWGSKHPVLIGPNGVDAISPQLYGAHFAGPIAEAERALNSAMKIYPDKQLWIGLSVECSVKDANAGHCSERLFDNEIKMASKAHIDAPSQVTKYVIWGERVAPLSELTALQRFWRGLSQAHIQAITAKRSRIACVSWDEKLAVVLLSPN